MYHLIEGIRILSVMLSPFIPDTAQKIWSQLNIKEQSYESIKTFGNMPSGTALNTPEPLFGRIDTEEMIKEIEKRVAASAEPSEPKANAPEIADEIEIDDFFKSDLRVAKVIECEKVKKSKKLLKLQLNDGYGTRQVVSGIAPWYKPEELVGKKVIIVANLKPVKLCGELSSGMICATDLPDGNVRVMFADDDIPVGSKIR
jgi:methionyl-tRNA synthetase